MNAINNLPSSKSNADNNTKEENELSDYFFKYFPYWPLFALLMLLCLMASFIYLRYAVPVYEISANILIKDEKGGSSSDIMQSFDFLAGKKVVENEIEVLKSRTLMRQVVLNLQLYAPIMEEGRVKDADAFITSPVKIEAKQPEAIREKSKIFFSYDADTKTIRIKNRTFSLYEWQDFDGNSIRFIPNKLYRSSGYSEKPMYFSLSGVKGLAITYSQQIVVAPTSKQSSVITLKMKDVITQRGEAVINELINVYNKAAIADKNILASNTLAFVEDRLKYVVNELDSVEVAMQRYKTQRGIVDITQQGRLFLQSVEANDQKVAEMNMQLAVLDQIENYVKSKEQRAGIVPSTLGVTDAVLSQLLQRLYDLEVQYEKLRKTTGENNPVLLSLQGQIDKVKPSILENITNQRANLSAGRTNLASVSSRYASVLRTLPQKERELLEISRQQVIKNNIYTFLLQKREETALSFASTVADSRTIDVAESSMSPVSPNKKLIYLIALAGGFALAVLAITIRELMSRTVLFRSDIEKSVNWPIIGEIAQEPGDRVFVVGQGERNVISEQFRHIRSSLAYLGINEKHKKILITSTISGEGKTFVAANLALTLALTNKKVILLELDLRKPKLSPLFNISKENGITNYLIGRTSISDIIKKTAISDNLFFIPSGPIPPNPSELILSQKMEDLLHFLEQEYDYVLIDTAPVAPVTDAHILTNLCDTTIYVIRHRYTPKSFIKRLEADHKVNGLKNPAIIFNGLKGRGFGTYGNRYGYGYGYGYGYEYGQESKSKKSFFHLNKT